MIELSQVIRDLRAELNAAVADLDPREELLFEVGPIELEMTVAISREASAGAKVRFWVVEGDGGGRLGQATTQRITLSLEPRLRSTGRRPDVSGQADERER